MASFKNILEGIGKAPLAILRLLASPMGQKAVAIGETIVETEFPLATGVINIMNKYASEIMKVQALGAAAASSVVTNEAKAAAVVNEAGPVAIAFAQANGLATPTADELLKMNNLVVEFMNVFKPAVPTQQKVLTGK